MTITALAPHAIPDGYTASKIAPENMGIAMSMFSVAYTRPFDASIRELAANALDSQVAAGNPAPIQISLPSVLDPNLTISDQGLGMSAADVVAHFVDYLASSKRENSDAMGTYGIGVKAPYAVSDQYYLTAIKDGVKIYVRFVLQDNQIPIHKILSSQATNEPNGVSITVPLPLQDFDLWVKAAERVLYWWEPGSFSVTSHPEKHFRSFREDINTDMSTDEVLFLDPPRWDSNHLSRSMVRMGSIAYEISGPMLRAGGGAPDNHIVLQAPNKSFEVTAPREGVKDTEDARQAISEAIQRWRTTLSDRYLPQLEAATTTYAFYQVWEKMPLDIKRLLAPSHLARYPEECFGLVRRVEVTTLRFIGKAPGKKDWILEPFAFENWTSAVFVVANEHFDHRARRVIQEWRRSHNHRNVYVIWDVDKLAPLVDPDSLEWVTIEQLKDDTPKRGRVKIPVDQVRMDRLLSFVSSSYRGKSGFHSQGLLINEIVDLLETGLPLVIGSREDIEEVGYTKKAFFENAVVIARGGRTVENVAKLLGKTYFSPQSHLEHMRSLKVAGMTQEERQLIVERSVVSDRVLNRISTQIHRHLGKEDKAAKAVLEPLIALKNVPLDPFLAEDPAMPKPILAETMPLVLSLLKCTPDAPAQLIIALGKLDAQNAAKAARKMTK